MNPDRVLAGFATDVADTQRTADDVPKRPNGRSVPRRPLGRYVVALSVIALLAIASTVLTSTALSRQEKDAGVDEKAVTEINTGVLLCPADRLKGWLEDLGNGSTRPVQVEENIEFGLLCCVF